MWMPGPVPSRDFPPHLTQDNTWILCNENNSLKCSLNSASVLSFGKRSFTAVVELINPNSQLPFPREATGLETAESYSKAQIRTTLGSVQVRNLKLKTCFWSHFPTQPGCEEAAGDFFFFFTVHILFCYRWTQKEHHNIAPPVLLAWLFISTESWLHRSQWPHNWDPYPKISSNVLVNTECTSII